MTRRRDPRALAVMGALIALTIGQGAIAAARTHSADRTAAPDRPHAAHGITATPSYVPVPIPTYGFTTPPPASPTKAVDTEQVHTLDRELAGLERFVATTLHAHFTHTVTLDVETDSRFDVIAMQGTQGIDAGHDQGATYQAFGLVDDAVEWDESFADPADVLGYYEDGSNTVHLRAGPDTPYRRGILAHELTHALQDQLYGLRALHKKAQSADAAAALSGLIEGQAVTIERAYRASLPAPQQRRYDSEEKASDASAKHGSGSSDKVLTRDDFFSVLDGFAYQYGDHFVDELEQRDGVTAQQLFAAPPATTLEVLDPFRYDHARTSGLKHLAPIPPTIDPPGGLPAIDRDTLGSFFLYAILGRTSLSNDERSDISDEWDGDALVTWSSGRGYCSRWSVRAHDSEQLGQMHADLLKLAQTRTGGTVHDSGRTVTLQVCG